LKKALREQVKYGEMRDELSYSTSHLSAHLKFGTVSIRETYWAFADVYGKKCRFIAELYWRDFFAHILYAYPETLKGKYGEKMVWTDSVGWLNRWKSGKTGFPVVDAGMRELNQTGYMHNRSRMVVASFLVKTLGIDWRLGERYFAQTLTDYDVASNNGNWQNISSTGDV
jgi:deoxyribodipyrimidine photo-lyase